MDNASFYSKKRLCSAVQTAHCKLIFLPPYSPELNTIEKFWSQLKRYLRNILLFLPSLDDALHIAFKLWQLYNRSRSIPRPCTYATGETAQDVDIKFYGISKREK